ncbi:actin-related protein 6 [Ixodes scapularis]|uniref:actin-related protein 6 n=1 Tax=Ixodes scapularis TaxID=6945 RepID=UPI001A9E0D99|nr:actin-related protein 6 [Ixodes scapularis]
MAAHCLVVDNGGGSIKAGYTTQDAPRIIPNCITKAKSERRRQFVGDQLDDCKDMSSLFYLLPFQKGYLVNWDIEKQVWDYMFGKDVFNVKYEDTCIILTEPFFNFPSIRETLVEVLYEEYQFHSLLLTNAGALSCLKYRREHARELACLVVDTGFSFTHLAPYLKGRLCKAGVARINLGGKALTNHLKDLVSYRQLHVMDETYVMNQVKEDACFVSTKFWEDMDIARKHGRENTVARDYVLPDYTVIKRGYVRPLEETTGRPKDNEQMIRLNNERFMVPELLFHPSDIGIDEMGIPEALLHVVSGLPKDVGPHMLKNVLLTGGNACFPDFGERVYKELRSLCPEVFEVNVTAPDNPITYAWEGGVMAFQDADMTKQVVTKKQYEEHGTAFCLDKFDT